MEQGTVTAFIAVAVVGITTVALVFFSVTTSPRVGSKGFIRMVPSEPFRRW